MDWGGIPYPFHMEYILIPPISYPFHMDYILIPPIPHESIDSMKEGGFHGISV